MSFENGKRSLSVKLEYVAAAPFFMSAVLSHLSAAKASLETSPATSATLQIKAGYVHRRLEAIKTHKRVLNGLEKVLDEDRFGLAMPDLIATKEHLVKNLEDSIRTGATVAKDFLASVEGSFVTMLGQLTEIEAELNSLGESIAIEHVAGLVEKVASGSDAKDVYTMICWLRREVAPTIELMTELFGAEFVASAYYNDTFKRAAALTATVTMMQALRAETDDLPKFIEQVRGGLQILGIAGNMHGGVKRLATEVSIAILVAHSARWCRWQYQ